MPVYNGERFLAQALDSLLSQSFTDYEILLVNDGSTDNSDSICRKYAEKDSQIVYIKKQNEGVSVARNTALNRARGEYVMFVDADDVVFDHTLSKVAEQLKCTKPDILRFEFQTIDEQDTHLYPNHEARRRKKYNDKTFDSSHFVRTILRDEFYLCLNVIRRKVLEHGEIQFMKGCTYCEDVLFIMNVLEHSSTCQYVSTNLYGYRKFSGAVTSHFTQKNFSDVTDVFRHLKRMEKRATDVDWQKTIKWVAEGVGILLHPYMRQYGTDETKSEVCDYCSNSSYRIEWKTYPWFSSSMWRYFSIWKKIKRKFY